MSICTYPVIMQRHLTSELHINWDPQSVSNRRTFFVPLAHSTTCLLGWFKNIFLSFLAKLTPLISGSGHKTMISIEKVTVILVKNKRSLRFCYVLRPIPPSFSMHDGHKHFIPKSVKNGHFLARYRKKLLQRPTLILDFTYISLSLSEKTDTFY